MTSISNISPVSHISPAAMGKLSALIEQSTWLLITCRYLDVLPKIVENYNNTYHTTIRSTPAAVWAGVYIGRARRNIRANVDKMLATKVKTKGTLMMEVLLSKLLPFGTPSSLVILPTWQPRQLGHVQLPVCGTLLLRLASV